MSRNWRSLYDQIAVGAKTGSLLPKPTGDILNRFEDSWGSLLPAVYREFILLFGAGHLILADKEGIEVVRFEFWFPGCSEPQYDMTGNNMSLRELFMTEDEPAEPARRLYFGEYASCKSGYIPGDSLGWDAASGAAEGDPPVVLWPRDQLALVMVAPSFRKFLEVVCFEPVWVDPITNEQIAIFQRHFDPALSSS